MSPEQVKVHNWLRVLAEEWNLECLQLDDNGCCSLQSEEGVPLLIEVPKDTGHFLLSAEVCELPESNTEDYLRRLMQLNLTSSGLGAAFFGLIPGSRTVCLRYHSSIRGMDAESLANIICNFLEVAATANGEIINPVSGKNTCEHDAWVRI